MFPFPLSFVVIEFILTVIIGLIIGTLSGFLASIILRQRARGILKDACLGAIGFSITVVAEVIERGTGVESSASHFQLPLIAAAIVAAILPALHQWFRFKHLESKAR